MFSDMGCINGGSLGNEIAIRREFQRILATKKADLASWNRLEDTIPDQVPDHLSPLEEATRALIETNRDRIRGELRDGFQKYPKYSDWGIAESNIALLREAAERIARAM
jgi:hypothetical protein